MYPVRLNQVKPYSSVGGPCAPRRPSSVVSHVTAYERRRCTLSTRDRAKAEAARPNTSAAARRAERTPPLRSPAPATLAEPLSDDATLDCH
eukprot:7114099-Prymnesium_polylepis.3